MAKTIVVETPEDEPTVEIRVAATISSSDDLSLSVDGKALALVNGYLDIECDVDQIVRIAVYNFEHLGETWTAAAEPKSRPRGSQAAWDEGRGFVFDENTGYLSDYVTVTVTAISNTGARTQRIHVKTKPRHGKPDSQMQEG